MAKKPNTNLAERLFSPRYFRHRLAYTDALPQISLLGLLSGIASALIIIAFRSLFELPLAHWLPDGTAEGFESLPTLWHLLLPIIGGALLGGWLMLFKPTARQTGVTHVMGRMINHKGYMPFKNTLVQFVGGALAIISGQSAGREGPAVHLGAAISSQLGRYWHLPDNSIRMLIGCGTAGAIAASFNTPMAGVIFAMEVVMMEYTIIGFTPIIIAAVTATLVHNSLYGAEMAFMAPTITFVSMQELPLILVYGVILGALAALFTKIVTSSLRLANQPIMLRMLGAG
ncbi:MAG: chloride channel protein, partial [Gammaproteobacteria bacterium]|nr:chloride channel protein [Gammaproteobacteria bacterium]